MSRPRWRILADVSFGLREHEDDPIPIDSWREDGPRRGEDQPVMANGPLVDTVDPYQTKAKGDEPPSPPKRVVYCACGCGEVVPRSQSLKRRVWLRGHFKVVDP